VAAKADRGHAGERRSTGGRPALWPERPAIADWRQSHFAAQNLATLFAGSPGGDRGAPGAHPRSALLAADPSLAGDLSGTPFVALPGESTNVILVLLESVSGVHVAPTAAAHGRVPVASMPRLAAFGRDNLLWTRFFSLQRKTNRGAYAVLCGDLPDLGGGTPKMSTYPARGGRPCLPERLRDAGYRTAFVQAAPLGFMLKGQFMPRIGFETVRGREWFERAYARNVWGVDDRAFFERSLDAVDALRGGDGPWMLTLLNVGTHHPYIFPDDFEPQESSRFVRALAYLDRAFGEFVAALEARGVLEDTLLVVTSDESMGVPGLFVDPWDQARTQSWGFLAVRLPQPQARSVDAPGSQIDLALSILDAVGIGARGDGLLGRSVFREYAQPRALYFGNSNLGTAGALDPDGSLLICRDGARDCRRWEAPDGRIFATGAAATAVAAPPRLARVVAASGAAATPGEAAGALELVGAPVRLDQPGENEVIHGGQYVNLQPGDWLEVELTVSARGNAADARARLTHVLKQADPPAPYVAKFPLRAGQTLRLRYSYAPQTAARDIQCSSNAELLRGDQLELDFETARMTVHRDGAPPAPGLEVAELSIEPRT